MPKISVIVPIYNSGKYLDKCLQSLLNQTFKDFEIIAINDGSTDNSLDILNNYQDSRIKIKTQKNSGQANTRNNGLKIAKGEYIIFIDSDDYVDTNMFEKLIEIGDYDIICFDYFIQNNNKDTYMKVLKDYSSKEITPKEYLFSDMGPCNKMFKREFLNKHNFKFPENIIYEDYASIPVLAKYNPKVYYLNKAFFHYVHHEGSTTHNEIYKEKYQDILTASQILYENLHNRGLEEELEYLITYHLLYLGSLNFYRFQKYEFIDKISSFMQGKFPKFLHNPYITKLNFKKKLLMKLFYHRKYGIIRLCQKLKR